MKKFTIVLVLAFGLLLGVGMVSMADSGFHFALGYEETHNDLSISIPDVGPFQTIDVDLSSPCKMWIAELGYDFNESFSLTGSYSWGTTDLAGVDLQSYGSDYIDVSLDQENSIFKVEGMYKFPINSSFSFGAIVGYADYDTTTTGEIDFSGTADSDDSEQNFDGTYTGELEQDFDGAYIGGLITYAVNDCVELGAAYRWMLSPDGELTGTISDGIDSASGSVDMDDLSASVLDIYAKAAINDNWGAKVGYTYTNTDYTIDILDREVDFSNTNSGLYAMVEYKFQ